LHSTPVCGGSKAETLMRRGWKYDPALAGCHQFFFAQREKRDRNLSRRSWSGS
jgi:hypothetical protein